MHQEGCFFDLYVCAVSTAVFDCFLVAMHNALWSDTESSAFLQKLLRHLTIHDAFNKPSDEEVGAKRHQSLSEYEGLDALRRMEGWLADSESGSPSCSIERCHGYNSLAWWRCDWVILAHVFHVAHRSCLLSLYWSRTGKSGSLMSVRIQVLQSLSIVRNISKSREVMTINVLYQDFCCSHCAGSSSALSMLICFLGYHFDDTLHSIFLINPGVWAND